MASGPYYRLSPGLDVAALDGGRLLLGRDDMALVIEAGAGDILREDVLPLLNGRRSPTELSEAFDGLPIRELEPYLEGLARAGLLQKSSHPWADASDASGSRRVSARLSPEVRALCRSARGDLLSRRVTVLGLEGPGAHAAILLARAGIGHLVLADPFPCEAANLPLMPGVVEADVGRAREDVVAGLVSRESDGETRVSVHEGPLGRDHLERLAYDCDLILACFDRGFLSAHYWANKTSLANRMPCLHTELMHDRALIGPLVLPGQSSCYMCYRMRRKARAADLESAMAYEHYLDASKQPALHSRGISPRLSACGGVALAEAALRYLAGATGRLECGEIREVDPKRGLVATHRVLPHPECPHCAQETAPRSDPALDELRALPAAATDVLALRDELLSPAVGLITASWLDRPKVGDKAPLFFANCGLANSSFAQDGASNEASCFGKGLSGPEAWRGCLGEAVERYAGGVSAGLEIHFGRIEELPGLALDPRDLVLFAAEQYAHLDYRPFDRSRAYHWIAARALGSGERLYIPANAVMLAYDLVDPESVLFPITSNGLAAGGTLPDAILRACYEVIERDAFSIAWMNRLPIRRVEPARHPDAGLRSLIRLLRSKGFDLSLFRLPTDNPVSVFLALVIRDSFEPPAAAVGLGSDLDPSQASRAAVLESLHGFHWLRNALRLPDAQIRAGELIRNPSKVSDMRDHGLLYANPQALGAFDFLLSRPVENLDWGCRLPATAFGRLALLAQSLSREGHEIIYCNLTPRDVESLGLHVVRVVIPGFQPLDVGHDERRLGGTRLFDLPVRLGLAQSPSNAETLNEDPHPMI